MDKKSSAHREHPTSICCADEMQSAEVIMDCLTMLAASIHLDTAICSFLESVGCFYGAESVFLFRTELSEPVVSCASVWPASDFSTADTLDSLSFKEWFDAFDLEGLVHLSDGDARLAALRPFCDRRLTTAVAVPMYVNTALCGFLCVVDPTQHQSDMKVLQAVASLSVVELQKLKLMEELDCLRYKDSLTGVYNRFSYVSRLSELAAQSPASMGVMIVSVNGLKTINSVLGNTFGDSVVKQTAEIMTTLLESDIYRINGDEFLSLHPNLSADAFQIAAKALRAAFAEDMLCTVSVGTAWSDRDIDIYSLIALADHQLDEDKSDVK